MMSKRTAGALALLALLTVACSSTSSSAGGATADVATSPQDVAADVPVAPQDTSSADVAKADVVAPKDAAADTAAPETLDEFINSRLATVGTPGLAFCLIKGGKVALCKGYGVQDVDAQTPITQDSIFGAGDLSQLVVAAAVMQQVEAGKLALDTDIDTYLGYSVRNPAFPDVPLTLRMLLTYTSSIQDPDPQDVSNDSLYAALGPAGDPTETLAQFVDAAFKVGGKRYDAKKNFTADKPGTVLTYSMFSAALAGYLVEKVSGQSFDAYTKAKIFTPLGMAKSTWHLAGIDMKTLALPYTTDQDGNYQAYEPYGAVDYPDSGLHTSVAEFSRFLLAFILDGSLDGAKILEKTSVAELVKVQYPKADATQGLIWYTATIGSDPWLGDGGFMPGYTSDAYYRPSDGVGFVLLGNGEWAGDDTTIQDIEDRLIQEAVKL